MNSPDIPQLLALAQKHLNEQSYSKAKAILSQILSINPLHSEANEFLAYVYGNQGNTELSHKHLFIASKSATCSTEVLYYLGASFLSKVDFKNAEVYFVKCIEKGGEFFEVLHELGTTYAHLNKKNEALTYYKKALTHNKNSYQLYFNIARILDDFKKFEDALIYYEKSISLNPKFSKAWLNRGISLHQIGRYEEAINHYDKAISLNKNYPEALVNKGATLNQIKKFKDAITCYDQAINISPEYPQAWTNKGVTLNNLGRHNEALAHHKKAINLNSDFAEAWSNAGIALNDLMLYEEAIKHYDTAIKLDANLANAYWNKSLTLLTLGSFTEGWDLYEYRWQKHDAEKYKYANIPKLESTYDVHNKKILVWSEQGFGDTLHFYRYVNELEKKGAKVTFEVQKSLAKLMQINLPCKVTDQTSTQDTFDFQIPLLSLPRLFKTEVTTIPHPQPPLSTESSEPEKWKKKLNLTNSRMNIGVAISGNIKQQTNAQRSIPLEKICGLSKFGNIYLIQNNLLAADLNYLLKHPEINYLGEYLSDFTDTAAIVSSMDMIISTCTSLVHLAGSMNKKTFLMSRWAPDWRWLLDRYDSPWYPSLKIFRQKRAGDWDSVITAIEKELSIY